MRLEMNEKDFIKKIYERNITYVANRKGVTIGLFWVLPLLNNKVIYSTISPEDSEKDDDFIGGNDDHYSKWEKLINNATIPEPYNKLEYDQIPRGRVIYNIKDDKYLMLATSSIINNKLLCEYIFINYCNVNDFTKYVLVDDWHYRLFSQNSEE